MRATSGALRWWACGVGLLLLAGCATRPVKQLPTLPPAEQAAAATRQAAHEAWTQAHRDWSLQGRVALSNGRDGGSGRIDWHQQGARYDVSLSAPITRQSWRLDGDDRTATLSGLDGGPRSGPDPVALLREATRWEIPVAALSSWIRGARADEARHGAATLAYGSDGRLARLEQAGWVIDYGAWQTVAGAQLPVRLNARRDEASVRLIVDTWGTAAAP
jgi:outer membrane lipoprotein LolB